jgi:hypothetical protein
MHGRVAVAIAVGVLSLPAAAAAQQNPADAGRGPAPVQPEIVRMDVKACPVFSGDPMPGSANDPIWRARHPGLAEVYASSCPKARMVRGGKVRMVPPLVVNEGRAGRAPSRSESVPAAGDSPE